MRPRNEWFKPEQLRRYYVAYEVLALTIVLAVGGVLAVTGILAAMRPWVVLVGGAALVTVFGYLTWWIPAFYRTADYRFTDDEIEYRRGVFFQQKTTVPYNRITNVGVSQGPIQRLVNVGSVGVHTAGYGGQTGAELTIGGLDDFEDIKEQILVEVRGRPAKATAGDDATDTASVRNAPEDGASEVLGELRRIRELLEQGQAA
jgi:membrane protein YdbS with pleckstrin-like domain